MPTIAANKPVRIEVAVGIVFDAQQQVLIGQRTTPDQYFEKWEFPGGKLEAQEAPQHALVREFKEEVGINITQSQPLMVLEHDYPDRQVRLHVFVVRDYTGKVQSREGQALQWVSVEQLNQLDFLQGNQAIIDALCD